MIKTTRGKEDVMSCRAHCSCFISLLLFGSFVSPLLIALIFSS